MRNALVLALAALLAALAVGSGAVPANASGEEVFVNCQTFESGGIQSMLSVESDLDVLEDRPVTRLADPPHLHLLDGLEVRPTCLFPSAVHDIKQRGLLIGRLSQ